MTDIPTYIQVQTIRAAAVLELLSAWDTATEVYCPGFEYVMFYMSYTEGGASGIFDFTLEVSLHRRRGWCAELVPAEHHRWRRRSSSN